MLLSKVFMGSTTVLIVVSAVLYGLWKGAEAKVEALQSNVNTLINANNEQQVTLITLSNLAIANASTIQTLGDNNNEINKRTQSVNTELNTLRVGIRQAALADSFTQSVNAYDRRKSVLMRVDGSNTKNTSANDSNSPET